MPSLPPDTDTMTEKDFQRLGTIIEEHCGIRVPAVKKTLVEGRLRRRVRALSMTSVHEYCRHLFDDGRLHEEMIDLIDAMTTNKTEFYRESNHFTFLVKDALPRLVSMPHHPGRSRPLRVWSAACSTGAEPYTLAMILSDYSRATTPLSFHILATDISTDVLRKAKAAIYPEEMLREIPPEVARRYLRRSLDRNRPTFRLIPEIRQKVHFGYLNLMDQDYSIGYDIDVIFCRNVLIYFDKPTQTQVLSRLCRHLRHGGYLFVGHSESVLGSVLPLTNVASAVFIRK